MNINICTSIKILINCRNMGRAVVVFINDDQSSTSQACHDNYVDYLVKFKREYRISENKDCIKLCDECYKIYEYITTLKNQCPEKISALAGSYAAIDLTSYCKRCDVNYKKVIKNTCCNDEKYELISGTDKLCKVNVVSLTKTISELEKHKTNPQLERHSYELNGLENNYSPEDNEKHTSAKDLRQEHGISGNKQQETLNSSNIGKHKD
ncbi:Plasmodium exported protein, unknown function [Plasmodium gonderi]|uniref:Variable surface protein n=1 Tax=Plasmodium gonderi TaxID=77519 RepID=A0A1Y1JRA7_PLAGO|nr:Plasmodium exported protein, unknown function [Plasmodium gonderi]GAW84008.1 Plasmodium exported protein, unknown function [Plasmodium gonderi]